MTRDKLLEALLVERQTSPWWTTAATDLAPDDDLTTARRRREMASDFDAQKCHSIGALGAQVWDNESAPEGAGNTTPRLDPHHLSDRKC